MSSQIATLSSCLELLKPQFKPSRVKDINTAVRYLSQAVGFSESFRLSSRSPFTSSIGTVLVNRNKLWRKGYEDNQKCQAQPQCATENCAERAKS